MAAENQKNDGKPEELSFNLEITNGAARLLQKIKSELKKDSAKEVVSLGLQIIDFALSEDADLIAKKQNGEEVRIVLNKQAPDGGGAKRKLLMRLNNNFKPKKLTRS